MPKNDHTTDGNQAKRTSLSKPATPEQASERRRSMRALGLRIALGDIKLPAPGDYNTVEWEKTWAKMQQAMDDVNFVHRPLPRLTQFHGTQVPVLIIFFLRPAEVTRLALTNALFQRVAGSEQRVMWRGLHCRDHAEDAGWSPRRRAPCVWQTLRSPAAGMPRCLYHLAAKPSEFSAVCSRMTRIPGRSREELLEYYASWRRSQEAENAAIREPLHDNTPGYAAPLCPRSSRGHATGLPPQPWHLRAHSTYGLSARHTTRGLPDRKGGEGLLGSLVSAPYGSTREPWPHSSAQLQHDT